MTPIASYSRTGGRPPEDDERLEIDEDGAWRLLRTMGGPRVGSFAGRLDDGRRAELDEALTSAAGAPGPAPETVAPDAARESVRAGEAAIGLAAGGDVAGAWGPLVELLRDWSGALASSDAAEAALELRLGAEGPVLERLGVADLRVWLATLHVDAYGRDADGVVAERASSGPGVEPEIARGEATLTTRGWSLVPDLPQTVAAPAGGALEAWAWVDIDGPDGPRRVRLVASDPA